MCFGGPPLVVKSTGARNSSLPAMRILVFGNGVAYGESPGTKPHFIGHRLFELLQAQFPGRYIEISNRGQSKEKASFTMQERLKKLLRAATDADAPFHWIIFAAGTDDVVGNIEAEFVKSAFEQMYGMAFSHGANSVAVTIPETPNETKKQSDVRIDVNNRIPQLSTSRSKVVDINQACPKKSQYMSTTSCFPTPEGYDRLAELVFEQMKELNFGDRVKNVPAAFANSAASSSSQSGSEMQMQDLNRA